MAFKSYMLQKFLNEFNKFIRVSKMRDCPMKNLLFLYFKTFSQINKIFDELRQLLQGRSSEHQWT